MNSNIQVGDYVLLVKNPGYHKALKQGKYYRVAALLSNGIVTTWIGLEGIMNPSQPDVLYWFDPKWFKKEDAFVMQVRLANQKHGESNR